MYYLVLVVAYVGSALTTNFVAFGNQEKCEQARDVITQSIKYSPGAGPSIKVAQCVKG